MSNDTFITLRVIINYTIDVRDFLNIDERYKEDYIVFFPQISILDKQSTSLKMWST